MSRRSWHEVELKTAIVPEREGHAWTPVLDYLSPGKLYRLEVPPRVVGQDHAAQNPPLRDQTWRPQSAGECTADGDPAAERSESLPVPNAPVGALLAKIGGSTADLKPVTDSNTDKDKDADKNKDADTNNVMLFAVGRYCVFSVETGRAGPLFLGTNDTTESAAQLRGHLEVKLFEAL